MERFEIIAPALAFGVLIFVACREVDDPSGPQPPASALSFTAVTAGYFHTCGVTTGRRAYCWGGNTSGLLGDGTRTNRNRPAEVVGGLEFSAIDAGAGHTCALTGAGQAYCWGWGDEGQLGDGSFRVRDTPVPVSGGRTFAAVSAGHAHSCAVTSDGIAFCWGDDSSGQLGDGGPGVRQKSAVPVAVSGGLRFTAVQAGYYQTCGLTVNGAAYCWGQNDSGQNGDGTTVTRHVPSEVATEGTMSVLSPGDRFVCGARGSVTLCWGANRSGELGAGAPTGSAVPIPLAGAPTFVEIFTSIGASTVPTAEAYGCGLEIGGTGRCWGGAIRGMRDSAAAGFAPFGDGVRFRSLALGSEHVCGLSREGYAYCAGGNYSGQLGDGTFEDSASAVPVEGPGE